MPGLSKIIMYIGIDMGGTNIRVAAASDLENPQIKEKLVFKNDHNFDRYMNRIIEFCKKQKDVSAVGVSTNGWLNKDKTVVLESSSNAPEKINKPLVEIIRKKLDCQVNMENDAVVAALGEKTYGRKDLDEFIYLIWGTGIGGAIAKTVKGKMKYKQIYWPTYLESWERECGVRAVEKKYGKSVFEFSNAEWDSVITIYIENLQKFLNKVKTKHVIFGGGMAVNKFDKIKKASENLGAELLPATFGDDAGLYGAFALISRP